MSTAVRRSEDRRLHRANAVTGTARFNLELLFEEIVTNIIRYAFSDGRIGTIAVSLACEDRQAVVVFEDHSRHFA